MLPLLTIALMVPAMALAQWPFTSRTATDTSWVDEYATVIAAAAGQRGAWPRAHLDTLRISTPMVLPSYGTLPSCTSALQGRLLYRTSNDRVYYCRAGRWKIMAYREADETTSNRWNFTDGLQMDGANRFNAQGRLVPHTVSSTSKFGDLNADRLDGFDDYLRPGDDVTTAGYLDLGEGSLIAPRRSSLSCGSADQGKVYYDTDNDQLAFCSQGTWKNIH